MTIRLANAPVSYGAFEMTVGVMDHVPTATRVLDEVARAGFAGIDLGPEGYLADGGSLPAALAAHNLQLVGGYVSLPFASRADVDLGDLDRLLDTLTAVTPAGTPAALLPKPTLADAGTSARSARIGLAATDHRHGLDDHGWNALCSTVQTAVDRCRSAGFEPTFHHHAGSYVEAPWEIDRLLEGTDVQLCLDTGHLVAGGGDPLEGWARWRSRINHIHLKDVRRNVVAEIVAAHGSVADIWSRGAFCRLGDGDLDVAGLLAAVGESGYAGWVVVEQDRLPIEPAVVDEMIADQRANREYLRPFGL
ncbi:MAG: TIM barrel protein [Ilumatobacteraceae bacterium]